MERSVLKNSARKALRDQIPSISKPILKAFIFGYASSVTPRLLSLSIAVLKGKKKIIGNEIGYLNSVLSILRGGLELQRFPSFCAALVGGTTLLEIPVWRLVQSVLSNYSSHARLRATKFISALVAAWFSLKLLHSKKTPEFVQNVTVDTANGQVTKPTHLAGRTIDLTLFAVVRALDVVVGELWTRRKTQRISNGKWNGIDKTISMLADPLIFSVSSAVIMFTWIYNSDRLPRSYNKWIKSAAAIDMRLIEALRQMRDGRLQYGCTKSSDHVIRDMCKDYNWPLDWGDHSKTIPLPCTMLHLEFCSCEYHAFSRLVRSFVWALSTYLPLNLVLLTRSPSMKALKRAIKSSLRSSAFLGAFIALYYYGVCTVRTRLGPRLLGTSVSSRQLLDSGMCIAGGCTLCGWSVLIENSGRRRELGLFVAPRALATLMPRKYPMKYQWRETLAFSISTAVIITSVTEKPNRVRGLLGRVLQTVLVQ
ncbi:hypothetical protein K3495_g6989 [Podosphaera aphanis]|nr:hypothetical protein K3495_g6989 [Podosphaera aphanis]